MKKSKPDSRTGAAEPSATEHLSRRQKQALDLGGDAEHSDGAQREAQTREVERFGRTSKESHQQQIHLTTFHL